MQCRMQGIRSGRMQFKIQLGNGNVVATRAEGYVNGNNGNQIRCYNCRGLGIQLQVEQFDLMVTAGDTNEIEEVNMNCILMANLYKGQEKCFEFNQQKFDELENGYRKSVYQEQSLTKKINALYLSSAKQIMTLNEEIENLNNSFSKEKSSVSYLQQEKERRKSDFKTRKDELLDKLILSEKKIKELDNILVKTGQSIQMMHMLLPKQDSFLHKEQKGLRLSKLPSISSKLQPPKKQQSLYNGRVLLEKHYPLVVYDSEETLQLAQESQADESLDKIMVFENENERLLRAVVSRDIMSIVKSPSGGRYIQSPN
ncbi:hypothetical protein Tco_0612932 [Tanacetum coccineum]